VLPRVLLVRDLDLDAVDLLALVVLLDPVQLLLDVLAEPVGDLAVAAVDDDFHGGLPALGRAMFTCHRT
jgi:hypothetical protein